MKVALEPQFPLTDESVKQNTGKSREEWFAIVDEAGGISLGRMGRNKLLQEKFKVDPWWMTTLVADYEEAKGLREKDGLLKGYYICSTKSISAPVSRVYAAWTNLADLNKWYGDGIQADFAVGGKLMSADGETWEFKRIREDKDLRVSLTFPGHTAPTIADVTFAPKGDAKCAHAVLHDRIQTRAEADGFRAAWGAALDRLKALCEAG